MLFFEWLLVSVMSCGNECLHGQHVGQHLLLAKLDSSLWRRRSCSKLCSLVAHHLVAAEQRWPPTACDKPKATWTSLQRRGGEVGFSAPHASIMCAGHAQMATAAQLAHGNSLSHMPGSDHAWSHGRAGLCPSTVSSSRYRASPAPLPSWQPSLQRGKGFWATQVSLPPPWSALAPFVFTCPPQV